MTSSAAAPASLRRIAFATIIGTTIEWYDFFIYATTAGLVFAQLFFQPAGKEIALLLSFATVGISFLFRPLGAFLAGHFGDIIGRKAMLVATLVLMGAATTLIGVLPTYAQIGILAPVLLLLLRILQGLSAGGEWGGAVLMAVEHAPADRRGRAGSWPQLGVPLGFLLASGVTALMTGVISPGAAYLEWGWRVPFLLSAVLIVIGFVIRRSVSESPVFEEIAKRGKQARLPIVTLFKRYWHLVILAALVFVGNGTLGYMTTGGFLNNYAINVQSIDTTAVLVAAVFAATVWFFSTLIAGYLADVIGRRHTFLIGFGIQALVVFPVFWLVDEGGLPGLYLALLLISTGLGLTYGPLAAWYSEIFPASVRFSGVSITYAIGAVLGGAFAPMIAQMLLGATGTTAAVSGYLLLATLLGAGATLCLRDRSGIPLGPDHEAEQATGATIFASRTPVAQLAETK
ncbi:MFS family permease [Microbacterium keratanolyticum]|uniref:MFS transporter n=1 Tax=Microbacterium keratanolyticum TaxID=67574 RepID=A0A9W6HRD3_9MICO|nr:MFS transporter [Microbacterium keratanolyticum]MBM7468661.1 MFS family permease [Microbacterium keratanolyticum]GLK00736.1 MFS transporter [Microbacterium keratanolyticum]